MKVLPLFPLSTVLFPNTPLRLHIFEPRYKKMIQYCLDTKSSFGVTLIQSGQEANGPLAVPYRIGCTAEILHVEHLGEGRINLVAVGRERFQIIDLDSESQPYYLGHVEPLSLENTQSVKLEYAGSRIRKLLERYLRFLVDAGITHLQEQDLPNEPAQLAYMAAALVQTSQEHKQYILEINQAPDLLEEVIRVYQRELALVKILLHDEGRSQGGFSSN